MNNNDLLHDVVQVDVSKTWGTVTITSLQLSPFVLSQAVSTLLQLLSWPGTDPGALGLAQAPLYCSYYCNGGSARTGCLVNDWSAADRISPVHLPRRWWMQLKWTIGLLGFIFLATCTLTSLLRAEIWNRPFWKIHKFNWISSAADSPDWLGFKLVILKWERWNGHNKFSRWTTR